MIEYKSIDKKNRSIVNRFLTSCHPGGVIVLEGEVVELTNLEGMVALEGFSVEGVITYRDKGDKALELVSVNSASPGKGVGTMLTTLLLEHTKKIGYKKLGVFTTNDDIEAIEFYQKMGFDMKAFYPLRALEAIKGNPSLPAVNKNGIPVRHELYFEAQL